MKMNFKQYIEVQESGLFTKINELSPFIWNDFFTPERLDILFLFKHGNKPLISSLYEIELDTLAKIVYTSYKDRWEKLFKVLVEDDTPLNQMYKLVVDETISTEDNLTYAGEIKNKEGAFNTDELIISGGVDNNSLTENEGTRNRLTEQSRIDNETLLRNMKHLEDTFLLDIVFNDVKNLIMLKIY